MIRFLCVWSVILDDTRTGAERSFEDFYVKNANIGLKDELREFLK